MCQLYLCYNKYVYIYYLHRTAKIIFSYLLLLFPFNDIYLKMASGVARDLAAPCVKCKNINPQSAGHFI